MVVADEEVVGEQLPVAAAEVDRYSGLSQHSPLQAPPPGLSSSPIDNAVAAENDCLSPLGLRQTIRYNPAWVSRP